MLSLFLFKFSIVTVIEALLNEINGNTQEQFQTRFLVILQQISWQAPYVQL